MSERKLRLADAEREYAIALKNLNLLKEEIVKCLEGKSSFSKDTLAGLISDTEKKCNDLDNIRESIKAELKQTENLQTELCNKYDEIISWSELFDNATTEAKKMIVNSMIKRIDVFRDYRLEIEFNFDIRQFFLGIDAERALDLSA